MPAAALVGEPSRPTTPRPAARRAGAAARDQRGRARSRARARRAPAALKSTIELPSKYQSPVDVEKLVYGDLPEDDVRALRQVSGQLRAPYEDDAEESTRFRTSSRTCRRSTRSTTRTRTRSSASPSSATTRPRAQGDEDEQGRHHLVPQDEGDAQDAVPRAHQPGARRRLRERRRERAAPAPGRRARRLGRDERERRRRRARHRRHGAGRRDRRQALRLDEPDRVQDGPPRGRQLDAGHGRLGDERRLRGVHALPAARELRHRLGLRRQL